MKKGQKIRAWVNPPPLFGQCPKENVLFLMMSSLRLVWVIDIIIITIIIWLTTTLSIMIFVNVVSSIRLKPVFFSSFSLHGNNCWLNFSPCKLVQNIFSTKQPKSQLMCMYNSCVLYGKISPHDSQLQYQDHYLLHGFHLIS